MSLWKVSLIIFDNLYMEFIYMEEYRQQSTDVFNKVGFLGIEAVSRQTWVG